MKLLVVLALVGVTFAAPQAILRGVPGITAERDGDDVPVIDGDFDAPPRGSGGFPFQFPFPSIFSNGPSSFDDVSPSGLPDNYDNSTHEVKDINGTKVEMNSTTTKHTGVNGGVYFTHIHTVRRLPGEGGAEGGSEGGADEVPVEDAAQNEVQNIEAEGSGKSRSRRWILKWINKHSGRSPFPLNAPLYHPFAAVPYRNSNTLAGPSSSSDDNISKAEASEETEAEVRVASGGSRTRIPIRNNEDIAINYLGAFPRDANRDAEIFDADLVREDERRFFEGRSQPMRAQPVRGQPIRAQLMMSQPIRAQPMMPQPIRALPMVYQPIRAQPMMSQPIRALPMVYQPIRAQPMISQPIRGKPRL